MAVSGAWTYTESGGNATITDYDTGIGGFTPTIPTTLDTFPVIAVGDYAMDNKSLTAVTIGHAIDLGDNALAYNSGMSVTLSADVTTVAVGSPSTSPFEGCNIGTGLTISSGVTTIPNYMFYSSGISSVTLPSTLTTIGKYAFAVCSLTSLSLPSSINLINNNAFADNSIASVTFDHAMTVHGNAFKGNTGISVTLDADITCSPDASYTYGVFRDCAIGTNLTITSNVTTIPDLIFASSGVTSVTLPSTVTTVNIYAFYGNSGITSLTIPSSLVTIKYYAFYGCGLTALTLPSTLATIERNAFAYNSIASLTLDNPITIHEDAFRGNTGISVTLDANITCIANLFITSGVFRDCAIGTNFTITSNVTTIPNSICANSGVTSVTLPSTILTIGNYAFYGNSGLTTITLPSSLTSIDYSAFEGCGLTALSLPSSVTSLGDEAFKNNSIAELTLSHAMTISDNTFALNSGLSLTIDANITCTATQVSFSPFEDCALGANVTITSNVTSIPNYMFGASGLTSVTFPSTVVTFGTYCLGNNNNLTNITFEATGTVTFGSNVLTGSQPSPKGTIYGYDSSVETWAAGFSTYYDFSYDVPGSSTYTTNFSSSMYNSSKFSKVLDFLA